MLLMLLILLMLLMRLSLLLLVVLLLRLLCLLPSPLPKLVSVYLEAGELLTRRGRYLPAGAVPQQLIHTRG